MNSTPVTQVEVFADKTSSLSDERPMESDRSTTTATSATVDFPQFDTYSGTQAQTARITGRLIAASVPESEYQDLLRERQGLVDKKLGGTITRRESIRLEYVRWSLGRIEDARHGEDLDRLEDYIDRYEHFLLDLDDFKAALVTASSRRR